MHYALINIVAKQKVGDGETTSSLAKKNGFFWRTIWEHPENAELKAKRNDPNVLYEDDDIFIPEKKLKEVSKPVDAEHKFKIKGEPAKLKIQLLNDDDSPRKGEAYVLVIDNKTIDGVTDGEGKIEHFIPPDATAGQIIMKTGREIFDVMLGYLDPIDKISGVQQRLNNVGFNCGGEMGEVGEKTIAALKSYQADNNLEPTGEIDAATKAKLMASAK